MSKVTLKDGSELEWSATHVIGDTPVMKTRGVNGLAAWLGEDGKQRVPGKDGSNRALVPLNEYLENESGTVRLTLHELAVCYRAIQFGRADEWMVCAIHQGGNTVLFSRNEEGQGDVRRIVTLPEFMDLPSVREVPAVCEELPAVEEEPLTAPDEGNAGPME